ncbi:hypothetical protein HYO26_22595 [Vibrio parahaemolyticus]|nr:hypothetical protein [Vibrio parahaemolyticus]
MKRFQHLLLVYCVPILLIYLVLRIVNLDKIGQGSVVFLSLVPMFICVYLWMLFSKLPYRWLRNYYLKRAQKIESYLEIGVKFSLVMFPVLYFSISTSLAQNGYKRVEVNRNALGGDSFYYKKNEQDHLKSKQGKLQCIYKEKNGKQIMACEEVY